MSLKSARDIDDRARRILFDAFWSSSGWRDQQLRHTPPEDFEYAKGAGIMFDTIRLSHDDIVHNAVSAVHKTDRQAVADAFVVSLASRRLDLRSALGSFAVLQHLSKHEAVPKTGQCLICGTWSPASKQEDLNVLNFERLKWGGVRHDQALYAGFDLSQFARLPHILPSQDDVYILKKIIRSMETALPSVSASMLEKNLIGAFKSNKVEREVAIGIFGLCGILDTSTHPSYLKQFVPWSARELPNRRFVDMPYPACWWNREKGISQEAIDYWFGHLL